MKCDDNDKAKKEIMDSSERIIIKTGSTTYNFSQSWIENKALKDILVDLIAEEL